METRPVDSSNVALVTAEDNYPHGDGAAPIGLANTGRPQVRGKFLYQAGTKYYVRGVTYGTFKPNSAGELFPEPAVAVRDLGLIGAAGFNAVRTYTPPPRWLLDHLEMLGLRVMVGLPWEQHITFLDSIRTSRDIRKRVAASIRACERHPSILCYTIGNEIPAPIVRWHGRDAVTEFLQTLYEESKSIDPDGLVTYVNYPTTEFLDLRFLDVAAFNVYLESRVDFERYLARLHNLVGELPLVMAEVGLDSFRNGEDAQAESLDWQIRSAFGGGAAGVFAFKWTDEWYRGGNEIEDWKFGLTTAERVPKKALSTVSTAMRDAPIGDEVDWPKVSVVVCTFNGSATIRDTLRGLETLDYPDFEVIVVNDGSSDNTPDIVREFNCQLVSTENLGLSSARNEGLRRSTGEIVAYIDDDAYPDAHWLRYLAYTFRRKDVSAVGGPNLLPPDDGVLAECISHAPGGPCHVLDTDETAEHIPGCNMAFRRSALEAVGGFDPQFRTAGDDVDLCWRLLQNGWNIGFHPGAVVWHHRRASVRTYLKQQFGYGKAEALLERKWPDKYNRLGHIPWSGSIYGRGLTRSLGFRLNRIYQGAWGQAPFQSLYERGQGTWLSLPLMPEWYLTIVFLIGLVGLSVLWKPLMIFIPLLALAVASPIAQAIRSALAAEIPRHLPAASTFARRSLIVLMHILQPAARLYGRLSHGLTIWRRRGASPSEFPFPRQDQVWSESWHPPEHWLRKLESAMRQEGAIVLHGGDFNRWDFQVSGGFFGSIRILMTIEEHGNGKQMLRFRSRPVVSLLDGLLVLVPAILATLAFSQGALTAGIVLGLITLLIVVRQLGDCSVAVTSYVRALKRLGGSRDNAAN